MKPQQPTVLVVGATGYLGGHLIRAFHQAGYTVHALARNTDRLKQLSDYIDTVHVGEATKPKSLRGICKNVDLVVSALGITRQRDGLSYLDVDYQANRNVLNEALREGVKRFAYVHVLNADKMPRVAMAAAKAKFARELDEAPIQSTVICPSGFYSDLAEILTMAEKGRVYLFGDGEARISPIDGADLATACINAVEQSRKWVNVGGPETLSQNDIASLAFATVGLRPRVTYIPMALARFAIRLAKLMGFDARVGALDFFLTASTLDMTAPPYGTIALAQDYAKRSGRSSNTPKVKSVSGAFTNFTELQYND